MPSPVSLLVWPIAGNPPPPGAPDQDDGWGNPAVARTGDVARVVLHGGSEAVWLDDVFERSAPGIQVITAG